MAKKAEKEILLLKKEITVAVSESWLLNIVHDRIEGGIIDLLDQVGIKYDSVEDLKLLCKQVAKNTGKRVSISKSDTPYKLRGKLISLLGGDLLTQEMLKEAMIKVRPEMVEEAQEVLDYCLSDAQDRAVEAFEYSDFIADELVDPQLRKAFKECGFDFDKAKQQLEEKKASAAVASAKALLESHGFNVTVQTAVKEPTKKKPAKKAKRT